MTQPSRSDGTPRLEDDWTPGYARAKISAVRSIRESCKLYKGVNTLYFQATSCLQGKPTRLQVIPFAPAGSPPGVMLPPHSVSVWWRAAMRSTYHVCSMWASIPLIASLLPTDSYLLEGRQNLRDLLHTGNCSMPCGKSDTASKHSGRKKINKK